MLLNWTGILYRIWQSFGQQTWFTSGCKWHRAYVGAAPPPRLKPNSHRPEGAPPTSHRTLLRICILWERRPRRDCPLISPPAPTATAPAPTASAKPIDGRAGARLLNICPYHANFCPSSPPPGSWFYGGDNYCDAGGETLSAGSHLPCAVLTSSTS